MSRLWDTPDFWARTEADELLHDFPNTDVRTLAGSFENMRTDYEGDPAFARDIAAELTRRADAGVRFWPEPLGLAALEDEVRAMLAPATADDADALELYWWQKL